MSSFLMFFGVGLGVFLSIDFVWLGLVAKNLYASYLGKLMAPQINWLAAGLFYAIYMAGLVWLVILPSADKTIVKDVIPRAAVFGLVAYATYDLTNWATLKQWPWQIVVIDMVWGTVLTAATAGLTVLIVRRWFGG